MTNRGSHESADQAVRLTYDRQMAKVEKATLRALRGSLLTAASGNVLEIGGWTGANLPCYRPEGGSLTITQPDTAMVRRLERRARERAPQAKILRAPAEDLPFEDGTFDTVVSTMVLCEVSDQPRALLPGRALAGQDVAGPVRLRDRP
jgi:ubiquinone/menaquinone biosynthesis C-methylase UbiE